MFGDWRFDVTYANSSSAVPTLNDFREPRSTSETALSLSIRPGFRVIDHSVDVLDNLVTEVTRSARYVGLFAALSELRNLDEEDPAAIDEDTFAKANTVLSLLAFKSADPPKIFSHGGDAAVFSWTGFGDVKYITVSGGCAVFAQRVRGEKPVTVGIADMSESNAVELLPYVGVIRDGSSTNDYR